MKERGPEVLVLLQSITSRKRKQGGTEGQGNRRLPFQDTKSTNTTQLLHGRISIQETQDPAQLQTYSVMCKMGA